jgi:UDP-N-acetylglucosamine--N-acetylmuramyl-(pentapeptide) pyrophosphoryl-undecaprenol N-acetylglucosamine transferase
MATKKGIPALIQEQNSYPGITNKLLSKKAAKICVAYDNLERFFPANKIIKTGNPVRQDLLEISSNTVDSKQFFNLDTSKKTLLILGGSLGARMINKFVENEIHWLVKKEVQVIWQTGKLYYNEYKKYDTLNGVQTHAFINRMDFAYSAADFIISRAGAGSISELCIVGKPTIFIPSPNVAENHQKKNALAIVDKDAAIMIEESDLSVFHTKFEELLTDESKRETLGTNIQRLALPNATKTIVDEIEKLIQI